MKIKMAVIVVVSFAGFFVQAASAGDIYKFRDAEGNILFTNIVSPEGKPKGKDEDGKDLSRYEHLEKTTKFTDKNIISETAKAKKAGVAAHPSGRSDIKQEKSNDLMNFFLIRAGHDFCGNIPTMYALMVATGEPASQIVRRINVQEEIRQNWIKDLLGIQKYGYDYNSCIAMYYGDIAATENITGYNNYKHLYKTLLSATASELSEAKKKVLDEEATQKQINEKKPTND